MINIEEKIPVLNVFYTAGATLNFVESETVPTLHAIYRTAKTTAN
jgi:hypothetical protein